MDRWKRFKQCWGRFWSKETWDAFWSRSEALSRIYRNIAIGCGALAVGLFVVISHQIFREVLPEKKPDISPIAMSAGPDGAIESGWLGEQAAANEWDDVKGSFIPFVLGLPQENETKNVRLWEAGKKINGGQHLPTFRQEVGDCVANGMAHAIMYLQCVQIAIDGKAYEYHIPHRPYLYGAGRVFVGGGRISGDGSLGSWQAKAVLDYGVLHIDEPGVPPYTGALARLWGKNPGPPSKYVDIAKQFLVRSAAKVTTADEVRDAICNGFTVTIASNWGGTMRPPTVDGRLVNKRSTSWAHQMCVIAYDGKTGREPYFYILNSWGEDAHGRPPDDSPPGGFWVRKTDMEYIVRQGDSFAISNFEGFPDRTQDIWDIFPRSAETKPKVRTLEEVEHIDLRPARETQYALAP